MGAMLAGCPSTEETTENVEQDVRGVYAPVFDETFVIKLHIGDTVRAAKPSEYAGYIEFGTYEGEQLLLNLGEFCSRADVVCPRELLGDEVTVDQSDASVRLGSHGLRVYPGSGSTGPDVYEGVVDHNDYDSFVLSAAGLGGEGICQTLDESKIEGRFTHTYEVEEGGVITWAPGEKVDGIGSGHAAVFFAGTCAFGPVGTSFKMSIEHTFIAYRVGDLLDGNIPETEPEAEDVTSSEDSGSNADAGPATAGGDVSF
tara:strand:+ start:684 stop:1454 length:771 start_codon:yes stop_codon:yes gene_type:complete